MCTIKSRESESARIFFLILLPRWPATFFFFSFSSSHLAKWYVCIKDSRRQTYNNTKRESKVATSHVHTSGENLVSLSRVYSYIIVYRALAIHGQGPSLHSPTWKSLYFGEFCEIASFTSVVYNSCVKNRKKNAQSTYFFLSFNTSKK